MSRFPIRAYMKTAFALALSLTAAIFTVQGASALEVADPTDAESITLEIVEKDDPETEDLLQSLNPQSYFLLLNDELVVSAEDAETLTGLVQDVVGTYLKEDTLSCVLSEDQNLELCYGSISFNASTDLEAAREQLTEELKVITTAETTEMEVTPFEQVTQYDDEIYDDEEPEVIQAGVDGRENIVTRTTFVNGEATSSEEVDRITVTTEVDEITVVGTKERPEYIWPCSGRVSSGFGPRNVPGGSRNHKGIDIAAKKGTPIYAAKAGKVTEAGYHGGYGNLVVIDHGDGTETRYGHNSSIVVSVGDTVEQGELIAKCGSTGNSTGPHCHFEIRIDGTPKNPRNYLD